MAPPFRFTALVAALSIAAPTLAPSAVLLVPLAAADATVEYVAPKRVGALSDRRVSEASGLVHAGSEADEFWIHNDSGGGPLVYLVDLRGKILGEVTVNGVDAMDWEDMARGPGPDAGRPYLYIADTGNNGRTRKVVTVYRILEPDVATLKKRNKITSEKAERFSFRFPHGPEDCEALFVHPQTGAGYVVTKNLVQAGVYQLAFAKENSAGKVQVATRIASFQQGALVTAADITTAGDRVVLRTYTSVVEFVWPPTQSAQAVFRGRPIAIQGPPERQGETIAYMPGGDAFVTVSEGFGAPVYLTRRSRSRRKAAAKIPTPAKPATPDLVRQEPLDPAAARRRLRLAPGYKAQLAASEPQIADPIDLAFDAAGQMWVCEMGDYPVSPVGKKPAGRIRRLTDHDQDGFYETSTLFADGLRFPTGLQCWRDGLIVTTSTQIVYLRDRDGDGKSDERRVIADGFDATNSQLLPNNPTWALDNHIYIANGLRAKRVVNRTAAGSRELQIRGRDLRLDPRRGNLEPVSGMGQFGITFNDWGARFVCSNRQHVQHAVFALRHLERNPAARLTQALAEIPDHRGAARLFPLTSNWTTSNLHTGTFTAACGVLVYRGDLLKNARGDAFVCDPTANVVHRDRLVPHGGTYIALRREAGREFLAAEDEWFRPVNLSLGPDGALYVVDMYRAIIEHPQFMPSELKQQPGFDRGRDLGRVYRIVPDGSTGDPAGRHPLPRRLDAPELVPLLHHRNAWQRETAQRLLVERNAVALAPILRAAVDNNGDALGRLHALWTLVGMGQHSTDDVVRALGDADPGVRRSGLILAASSPGDDRVKSAVLRGFTDTARPVRFQAVLAAGELPGAERVAPLLRAAIAEGGDRWFRDAILSAAHGIAAELASGFVAATRDAPKSKENDPHLEMGRRLAALCGETATRTGVAEFVVAVGALPVEHGRRRWAWSEAVLHGVRRRGKTAHVWLAGGAEAVSKDAVNVLNKLQDRAEQICRTSPATTIDRAELSLVIAFLHRSGRPTAAASLRELLDRVASDELKVTIIRALGSLRRDAQTVDLLLTQWKSLPPGAQAAAAVVIFGWSEFSSRLITALERKEISPHELTAKQRMTLLRHRDAKWRERAARALQTEELATREKAVKEFQSSLSLPADLERGREVFQRACSTCHRVGGLGTDVGPDISDTRVRSPTALLTDILDPNRAIDGNYLAYAVSTKDGDFHIGIVAGETGAAVQLRMANGVETTILRDNIAAMVSTGRSLMPEGFETQLSPQEMADLVYFLKNWRYQRE